MTVKQLKEYLADKPDNAECFFTIWNGDEQSYYMQFPCNDSLYDGSEGRKFLRLSWVDDAPAYKLKWQDQKLKGVCEG